MIGKEGHEKSHAWILEEIKKLDPKVSGKLIKEDIAPDLLEVKRFYESDLARKRRPARDLLNGRNILST